MLVNPLIGTRRAEEPVRDTSFGRNLGSLAFWNQESAYMDELLMSDAFSCTGGPELACPSL